MAARRCSTCSIDYPTAKTGACVACGGDLSYFGNVEPQSTEDIVDAIRKVVWSNPDDFKLYGGVTKTDRFRKTIESLRGADDFLTECGDWPAPEGNE